MERTEFPAQRPATLRPGGSHGSRRAGIALAALLLIGAAGAAWSQLAPFESEVQSEGEWHFARLEYSDAGGGFGGGRYGRRFRGSWLTDYPEAEEHLIEGVRRLTRIDAAGQGTQVPIMDEALFDYPWLYAVEVGWWLLDDEEAARLREYLLRGGFLMVDDFHGSREWAGFVASMERVFPDRQIVDLPPDSAVFHTVYDLDEPVQIPGINAYLNGQTYERDGMQPHWRGIFDDSGRLMVMIDFNMDLGDAWEHADTPAYPLHFTTLAYQYAINYIVYAMTH
jgi:hypothetical protein